MRRTEVVLRVGKIRNGKLRMIKIGGELVNDWI